MELVFCVRILLVGGEVWEVVVVLVWKCESLEVGLGIESGVNNESDKSIGFVKVT